MDARGMLIEGEEEILVPGMKGFVAALNPDKPNIWLYGDSVFDWLETWTKTEVNHLDVEWFRQMDIGQPMCSNGITLISGARGSGMTTLAVAMGDAIHRMALNETLAEEMVTGKSPNLYSNIEIEGADVSDPMIYNQLADPNALSLRDGVFVWDNIESAINSKRAMSTVTITNETSLVYMRKRGIELIATSPTFSVLGSLFSAQCDIFVPCRAPPAEIQGRERQGLAQGSDRSRGMELEWFHHGQADVRIQAGQLARSRLEVQHLGSGADVRHVQHTGDAKGSSTEREELVESDTRRNGDGDDLRPGMGG